MKECICEKCGSTAQVSSYVTKNGFYTADFYYICPKCGYYGSIKGVELLPEERNELLHNNYRKPQYIYKESDMINEAALEEELEDGEEGEDLSQSPTNEAPQKVALFRSITKDMADLYAKKNQNYGDSFGKLYRDLGPVAGLVPLHNKLDRLTYLVTHSDDDNHYESIEDTLLDLANYALMNLIERRLASNSQEN